MLQRKQREEHKEELEKGDKPRKQQEKELGIISDVEVLMLEIAGLCHDLGKMINACKQPVEVLLHNITIAVS